MSGSAWTGVAAAAAVPVTVYAPLHPAEAGLPFWAGVCFGFQASLLPGVEELCTVCLGDPAVPLGV